MRAKCSECGQTLPRNRVESNAIGRLVSEFTDVSAAEIGSKSREPRICRARQITMYLMREEGMTFPAIAELMDRHHATVIYAVEVVRRRLLDDRVVGAFVEALQDQIEAIREGTHATGRNGD